MLGPSTQFGSPVKLQTLSLLALEQASVQNSSWLQSRDRWLRARVQQGRRMRSKQAEEAFRRGSC